MGTLATRFTYRLSVFSRITPRFVNLFSLPVCALTNPHLLGPFYFGLRLTSYILTNFQLVVKLFLEISYFTTIKQEIKMTKIELLKHINNGKERGAQTKLASDLSLTTASVANWFSGKSYPTDENIKKIAKQYKLSFEEVKNAFLDEEFTQEVNAVPLTKSNTIQLPILADVPAGLPEFSDRDVEMFVDIPRFMFPQADYVVRCIGDSLEPKIHKGDFCVIRTMREAIDGRAMLVRTENGSCMKVIKKTKGIPQLCSLNPKYKPFTPKMLDILGLIIGHWSRDDKEQW